MSDKYQHIVPIITEKSTAAIGENKYVFIVNTECNKVELKQYLEKEYHIKVKAVNLANYHGKRKRLGRFVGRLKGYKKAVVTLCPGERFEAMEGFF